MSYHLPCDKKEESVPGDVDEWQHLPVREAACWSADDWWWWWWWWLWRRGYPRKLKIEAGDESLRRLCARLLDPTRLSASNGIMGESLGKM